MTDSLSSETLENGRVALVLAGVLTLQQSFLNTGELSVRQALLHAAADLMDRTVPAEGLKKALAEHKGDQVRFLIENRRQIASVPPGLWRKARVSPSGLPQEHQKGMKALELFLRGTSADKTKTAENLHLWLGWLRVSMPDLAREAFAVLPELRDELRNF